MITILGSGAAAPKTNRYPTAQALQVNDSVYLIDCAEGAQMQLRRYKVKLQHIKVIFVSHLHGDHVYGLLGLLSSLSMLDRSEPLDIYGPPYLDEWFLGQLKYFTPLGFQLNFHILTANEPLPSTPQKGGGCVPKVIFEDKNITVSCFPLKHRIPTWGFIFREKPKMLNIRKDMIDFYRIPVRDIPTIKAGADFITEAGKKIPNEQLTLKPIKPRSYAFCTDTVYLEEVAGFVRDVDLLYHEATYGNAEKSRAKETFHSTAEEASKIALAANVGKLVIGHFSSRYKDITPLLDEARKIFPNTEAAEDGSMFKV